jgi:hypothetical protein
MGCFGLDILYTKVYYSVFQFVSYSCDHISGVSPLHTELLLSFLLKLCVRWDNKRHRSQGTITKCVAMIICFFVSRTYSDRFLRISGILTLFYIRK